MKLSAHFKLYDALADYIDYFPLDKKLLFNIPDTILFEDTTPLNWYSTRLHYTGNLILAMRTKSLIIIFYCRY